MLQDIVLHAREALEKVDEGGARDNAEHAGGDAAVATLAEIGEKKSGELEGWRAGGLTQIAGS